MAKLTRAEKTAYWNDPLIQKARRAERIKRQKAERERHAKATVKRAALVAAAKDNPEARKALKKLSEHWDRRLPNMAEWGRTLTAKA